MAQDFEGNGGQITNSETTLRAAADSDDAIIGLRLANILTTNITVSVWIDENNSADRYLIKDVSIPAGSSVELIQGASKVVIMSGDVVKAQSSTADSCDFWLSVVDTISS